MKCAYCQQEFTPERATAKYCGDRCRTYGLRKSKRLPVGDAPDTSDVVEIAAAEKYEVPGVDPFWCKPHKLVFHSASEWRGCCVGVGQWRATCNQTREVVEAGSYAEMMARCREVARGHISEEVAMPTWTARMPQSVKPPKELDRSKSQLAGGKAQPKGGQDS